MAARWRAARPWPVRAADLDVMGHVNNAVYLTYLEEARMHYYQTVMSGTPMRMGSFILAGVTINYRSPAVLGEEMDVAIRVAEMRVSALTYAFRIAETTSGRLVADGTTTLVSYDYGEGRSVEIPEPLRDAVCAFEGLEKCRPD